METETGGSLDIAGQLVGSVQQQLTETLSQNPLKGGLFPLPLWECSDAHTCTCVRKHTHTQILIKQKLKEERKIKKLQAFFPGCWRKKKQKQKIEIFQSKEGGPPLPRGSQDTSLTPDEVWVHSAASEGDLTRPTSAFSPHWTETMNSYFAFHLQF